MKKLFKSIWAFGAGFLVHRIVSESCGFIISPYLVAHFSLWSSVLAMFCVSSFLCFTLIKLYDWLRVDWVLIEALKKAQETMEAGAKLSPITKTIVKWTKKGNWALGAFLICWDPTVTVLYFRKGYYLYDGIKTTKVLLLFLSSALLCNVAWMSFLKLIFMLWHFIANFI